MSICYGISLKCKDKTKINIEVREVPTILIFIDTGESI